MPHAFFLGEIEKAELFKGSGAISLSYAVVPGNAGWSLKDGNINGETHINESESIHGGVLNHPIDWHYITSTSEGWPFLVVEVWERDWDGTSRLFKGCGSVFLPTTPGSHKLSLSLWRPRQVRGVAGFIDMVLPPKLDIKEVRKFIAAPYTRPHFQTETCGTVQVTIHTVLEGFKKNGCLV